ncbi:exodeoxyribonuclease III [Corynebacterium yudongzhengii]|uniref:Exodeoxyribonuclease III n=1 Tax=Corynebacterium yudongzhengii TaxID=2080740 RepID=A0A2U1T5S0_9CORY|nr:exodeoxyribonuclease III [Corynebacterium yudongzhengii]AWB83047.1 exodeoxyribonuclease III [Corynebacterium yudongzhengii]PWC01361.1 exodeoxyribonuclease III [Corynebacterium yudongzhengii]
MRIASWNVNSARSRAERMVDFLQRHDVDVLAVQETKTSDAKFPYEAFEAIGYEVAHVGFNQWNGVAIISRVGIDDVEKHLPGQPGFAKDPDAEQPLEARAVGAVCGGVKVWSLYVPNGREIGDRHFDYKLAFLWSACWYARRELEENPETLMTMVGDFNVAERDEDVWDIAVFDGKTHVTEPERAAFGMLTESGMAEITRSLADGRYTYWDYKGMRYQKDEGMRIDYHLASPALAKKATSALIDADERSGKGASDHAPVIVDYHLEAARVDAPDYDSVR